MTKGQKGGLFANLVILGGELKLRGNFEVGDHGRMISCEGIIGTNQYGPYFEVQAWSPL